jgi:rod shape-determining protein MreD
VTVRRLLTLAAIVVAAVLLQTTVLAGVQVAGVRPDVLVLVVVAVAMASGPTSGAAFGFATGLVADLLVGMARVYVTSPRPVVHLALAAAASLASTWSAGLLLRVFDLSSWALLARAGPLVAGCNLLLAPFVYPVVRGLLARVPAQPVEHW